MTVLCFNFTKTACLCIGDEV